MSKLVADVYLFMLVAFYVPSLSAYEFYKKHAVNKLPYLRSTGILRKDNLKGKIK